MYIANMAIMTHSLSKGGKHHYFILTAEKGPIDVKGRGSPVEPNRMKAYIINMVSTVDHVLTKRAPAHPIL